MYQTRISVKIPMICDVSSIYLGFSSHQCLVENAAF